MATRRRYTAKQRAKAVGIAAVEGVTEAERQTGYPKESIQYWMTKPQFAQLRTTAREVVVDGFWVGIQVGLQAVVEGFSDPKVPLNHKSEALKNLAEKHQLLTGNATDRTETLTGELNDDERASLRRALVRVRQELTAERSAAAGDGGPAPVGTGTGETGPEGTTG